MTTVPLSSPIEVLVFRLERERFGLYLKDIVEIVSAVALVPLPSAPPVVLGIFSLRGDVVAVLDPRLRFGYLPRATGPGDHLVVCQLPERRVALRVDQVEGILDVAPGDIKPIEQIEAATRQVAGVAQLPEGLLLIHELAEFLSDTESAALERSLRAYSPDSSVAEQGDA